MSITESNNVSTTITFTLHLSAKTEIPVHVPWSTNNRTAIGGFDYKADSGIAVFDPNALDPRMTTITITLEALHNDDVAEPVEEFVINLDTPDQATLGDDQALGTIFDNDLTPISGRVFLDADPNGLRSIFEHGLAGLMVKVTYYRAPLPTEGVLPIEVSVTVTTNEFGVWGATGDVRVLMGATKIEVIETGLPPGLVLSTGNNPQTVTIDALVSTGADVGYKPALIPDIPPDAIGEGSGGLDDTVFGGGGNDIINGGGGNDHLVGGHWLLGVGCDPSSAYDAFLAQGTLAARIELAPAPKNAGGTLAGLVFNDINNNSIRDDGSNAALAGVTVNLFAHDYSAVATTVTDGNGIYSFSHLANGDYYVQFIAPAALRFVTPNFGSDDTIDSDANVLTGFKTGATGLTPVAVTVAAAATCNNVDAGLTSLPAPGTGPWAVSFGASAYNVWEKDGAAQIVIERVPGSDSPFAVLSTWNGTALAGADYTAIFRRFIAFTGAANDQVVVVSITPDSLTEGLETVLLSLRSPSGGRVAGARPDAVLLIFDKLCPDDDRITGGHGDDVILGDGGFVDNSGNAVLIGGNGNDSLSGGAGFDKLHGQGGNDHLDGGAGDDLLEGGTGDDTYLFDTDVPAGTDTLNEFPGSANGLDTLDFSSTTGVAVNVDLALTTLQDVSVIGIVKHLRLTLSSRSAIENVIGGGANDTLLGNGLDNTMTGGPGSDAIDGRVGIDTLVEARDVDFVLTDTTLTVIAPAESDTLTSIERVSLAGGPGANRFTVSGWTGAPVSIDGREGSDTIVSINDADFTLTDTQLVRGSGIVFNLVSIENAVLTGGTGNNTLDASAFTGSTVLTGGPGADTIRGASGSDLIIWNEGDGSDKIDGHGGSDTVQVTSLTGDEHFKVSKGGGVRWNFERITATLFALDIGTVEQLEINAGAGLDIVTINDLSGVAGLAAVTVNGGLDHDTLDASAQLAAGVSVTLNGDGGNDDLTGSPNADALNGGADIDIIRGRAGIDTIHGGAGKDLIIWNDGDGNDVIDGDADGDVVRINTGGGADNISFNKQGVSRFQVAGTGGSVFTLDIGGVETVELHTGLGDDVVTVHDLTGAEKYGADLSTIYFYAGTDTDTDTLVLNGTNGPDTFDVSPTGAGLDLGVDSVEKLEINTLGGRDNVIIGDLRGIGLEMITVNGGSQNDTLDASALPGGIMMVLNGDEGDDTLAGSGGDDTLNGGGGDDLLVGGGGNDSYFFGNGWGTDRIIESAGQGFDTADFSTVTSALTFNVQGNLLVQHATNSVTHAGEWLEELAGGSGDDVFDVIPSALTAFTLHGGSGTNTLNFNAQGRKVKGGANTLDAGGRATVTYFGMQTVNLIIEGFSPGGLDGLRLWKHLRNHRAVPAMSIDLAPAGALDDKVRRN